MSDIQTLNLAETKALVARLEAEAESGTREQIRPVVETLLTQYTIEPSKSSTFVGFSADPVEITVDGRVLRVSIIVTDVAAKQTRVDAKREADAEVKALEDAKKEAAKLHARQVELEAMLATAGQNRG